jgi:glycosyltransferase involved in cell wall biosynthesis
VASRILLWHGYLLSGSGSNIYTANVARVWRAQGHDVLLLCQDRRAHEANFVDAAGEFSADNRSFELVATGTPDAAGQCRVARPDIAGLLPVYVLDAYEGFSVKRFVDLGDDELQSYTKANIEAVTAAIDAHEPDAVVVGHEVMGPYIARAAAARTGIGYLAKLHGSALEYAVKLQDRYRRFAREGLTAAGVVTGGSRYMIAEASAVVPGWSERAEVVNPGCDVDLFRPLERGRAGRPAVGFVGKLLAAKGVHNLLAAIGLTQTAGMTLQVVGYGDFEASLRALSDALALGDSHRAEAIAHEGGVPLEPLSTWLRGRRNDARFWARARAVPVTFHGRLDHGPLASVLPTFDVLAVPSVVPEAFGMVAVEAAACGVLPIVPSHSGIGEVGAEIESALGRPGLLTYDPADPIAGLAGAIDRVLALDVSERRRLASAAADLTRARWSWTGVADRLLELGRVAMDRPPGGATA